MARESKYDWIALEKEYRSSGLSYKALAEKHGIPLPTLKKAAISQGWARPGLTTKGAAQLRETGKKLGAAILVPGPNGTDTDGTTVPHIKVLTNDAKSQEMRRAYFLQLTDAMANRIEEAIRNVDTGNAYAIKLLTGALVDLRDMQGLSKDPLDIEEQEARIAKLKMEANIVEEQQGVVVEFVDTEGAEN